MRQVFVTGMGIVSALGIGVESNHLALRQGVSGIKKAKYFNSKYSDSRFFGEVGCSDETLRKRLNLAQNIPFSRTDLFSIIAAEEAIKQAAISSAELSDHDTALISASTVGGMCHTDELYNDATSANGKSSVYINTFSCGAHTTNLVERLNIKGITGTINTACSSSANAIMLGARLIKSGRAKRVIVGGVDSLAKFTVNGFNALGILSEKKCRPFFVDRDGLTLGEGAGYLVLESDICSKDKNRLAEIIGYGNANDAFHSSAISENAIGPTNAMKKALEIASLHAFDIDFINAHGTGTENNDRTELQSFYNVFEKPPPFESTKSYTGHTLGAAGAIEAIFSILAINHNEIYQIEDAHYSDPTQKIYVQDFKNIVSIDNVLSNSFGFAGNCTALIFKKS